MHTGNFADKGFSYDYHGMNGSIWESINMASNVNYMSKYCLFTTLSLVKRQHLSKKSNSLLMGSQYRYTEPVNEVFI